VNYAEYRERKALLTPEQIEAVKAKCRWEGVPWLGIARDWPSMFDVEGMPPATPFESSPPETGSGMSVDTPKVDAVVDIHRQGIVVGWTDALRWCDAYLDLHEEDRDKLRDKLAQVKEHGK
jgi:hypothetical protein